MCADDDRPHGLLKLAVEGFGRRPMARSMARSLARLRSTAVLAFAGSLSAGSAFAADAALIAAAKKEGEVVWYSTQIISQLVRPVTAAFEKKYPGIKVRSTRANAAEVAIK